MNSRVSLLGFLAIGLLLTVELYALPNPTIAQMVRHQPSWQPTEEMAGAVDVWQSSREETDKTFVYYGAVPAFRYYLQTYGIDTRVASSDSASVTCTAKESTPICQEFGLYFSPWVRKLSPEEKISNMYEILGSQPDHLWLVFSHVHQQEDSEMVSLLSEQYQVTMVYPKEGRATIYLLTR